MLINITDLPISGRNFKDQIPPKALELELQFIDPIMVSGHISKCVEDVFVKGHVETTVQATCDRCLAEFRLPVTANFELFYQPYSQSVVAESQEISFDELGILHYKDNTIDLAKAIRDTIILEIPIKLLCNELCKGLCGQCGHNLNESSCNCGQKKQDYNPFKEFFQKQKS